MSPSIEVLPWQQNHQLKLVSSTKVERVRKCDLKRTHFFTSIFTIGKGEYNMHAWIILLEMNDVDHTTVLKWISLSETGSHWSVNGALVFSQEPREEEASLIWSLSLISAQLEMLAMQSGPGCTAGVSLIDIVTYHLVPRHAWNLEWAQGAEIIQVQWMQQICNFLFSSPYFILIEHNFWKLSYNTHRCASYTGLGLLIPCMMP